MFKKANCDKTEELKLWQNSKTQMVTKLKTLIVTKLKNSNLDKTQKLKLLQNSKNSNKNLKIIFKKSWENNQKIWLCQNSISVKTKTA